MRMVTVNRCSANYSEILIHTISHTIIFISHNSNQNRTYHQKAGMAMRKNEKKSAIKTDAGYEVDLEKQLEAFQNIQKYATIDKDSPAMEDMKRNLEQQIENKLKGVHTNIICQTKDGRFKTKNPQIIKKTRLELLIALYEYYFHDSPLPTRKKPTIKTLFPKWLETYKELIAQGHRSVGSLRHYISDYNHYLKGNELENRDITKITFKDIKKFYAKITANQAIGRKSLNNVKTLINQIFDYARDQNIPVINTHDIHTMDLCCKESDNDPATTDLYKRLAKVQMKIEQDQWSAMNG